MLIKKIIFAIAVLSFFVSLPAQAVKLAPGINEDAGPLQPIPEGIEPNIKSNIQDNSQPQESETLEQNSGQSSSIKIDEQAGSSSVIANSPAVSSNNSGLWIVVLVVLAVLLVFGLLWYRKMQSKKL
jgi:predicted PurR-regulated permease PerM